MNINFTLIIQMVVFALLIWFTMKFVWPMILGAMEAREKKIAAGLAAAEKGQQELSQARSNSDSIIREARERAQQIIDQALEAVGGSAQPPSPPSRAPRRESRRPAAVDRPGRCGRRRPPTVAA